MAHEPECVTQLQIFIQTIMQWNDHGGTITATVLEDVCGKNIWQKGFPVHTSPMFAASAFL
jgi:hypothetical protein